ncbi:MAG TPA: response regulator transcription factor [Actinomycetota bacterium]|nr:response regulator transcription factor [Actinomycetota bacterium]
MATRLLIVDDVADLRSMLATVFTTDERFEVVGQAGDGIEAVAETERLQPDVVLLDLAMPRLDGIRAIPRLHSVRPGLKIVVLSGFDHPHMERAALAACAMAFIYKGAPTEEILDLVDDVARRPPKQACTA